VIEERRSSCAYTNAEHQSNLGAHRNDCSRHEARHAAVLTDALRDFRRAAKRTAKHQATCNIDAHRSYLSSSGRFGLIVARWSRSTKLKPNSITLAGSKLVWSWTA